MFSAGSMPSLSCARVYTHGLQRGVVPPSARERPHCLWGESFIESERPVAKSYSTALCTSPRRERSAGLSFLSLPGSAQTDDLGEVVPE